MLNATFTDTYNTIASIQQDSIDGDTTMIYLQRKNTAAGTVKEFASTGEATTINMLSSGDDIFTPIKSSELVINTWNIENFDSFELLNSSQNKDIRAIVQREGITIWSGFLVPNQWYEPFSTTPYPTQLTFINGISFLKKIDFVQPDGSYYRGKENGTGLIAYLLSQTGIKRNFVDQINIIDENTDIADIRGTLFEKFYDLEAFRGLNCYEVLESVMRSLISRIEYYNNKFYIKRFSDANPEIKSVEYEIRLSGAIIDSNYTYNRLEEITPANANRIGNFSWIRNDAELSIEPGHKKLTINHNYGKKESIFPRSLFDDDDFLNNGKLKWYDTNGVEKHIEGDETAAKFKKFNPRVPGENDWDLTKPQFISGQTETNYDPSNQNDDLFEKFELTLNMKNDGFQVNQGRGVYVGKRTTIGGTTSAGTEIRAASNVGSDTIYNRVACKGFFDQGITIKDEDLLNLIIDFDDGTLQDPFFISFNDESNIPTGLTAGIFYYATLIGFDAEDGYIIRLKESTSLLDAFIVFDENVNNRDYEIDVYFAFLDVKLRKYDPSPSVPTLSLDGSFKASGYLLADVDQRDAQAGDFFSQSYDSNSRYIIDEGKLNFRIERIKNNVQIGNADRGGWIIESFRVQFKVCPESNKEEITLNADNNQEYTLDIDFAEVPIYTNFKNAVLRYYNVFYSRSLTSEPGLQYFDKVEGSARLQTMYQIIKSEYIRLLQSNRISLRGTIHSAEKIVFDKIIAEPYTAKKYIPTYASWNLFTNYHEIEMHEISNFAPEGDGSGADWNDDWNNDF